MKKIILFIFTLHSTVLLAQIDVVPISNNGLWINGSGSWILGEFVDNPPMGLAISDTVNINDTLYLAFSTFDYCNGAQVSSEQFLFLLREDAGKYYYKQYEDDVEVLWFDFTLGIGESILIQNCYASLPEDLEELTLVAIDPIILDDGSERNKWTLQYSDIQSGFYMMTEEWIEGIGTVGQGWRHPTAQTCIDNGHWLRCYYENDEWVENFAYLTPGTDCCTIVGIEEEHLPDFSLYPNPASSELRIQSDYAISFVEITDLTGRIVLRTEVNTTHANLNIASLSTGSYYISLTTEMGKVATKKFMKE